MSEGSGRSLVIDANILIRASLGVPARELIERYVREVAFFAPDIAFADVEEHLPRICADTGVSLGKAMKTYESVAELVQEMPAPMYSDQEREARARIEKVQEVPGWRARGREGTGTGTRSPSAAVNKTRAFFLAR